MLAHSTVGDSGGTASDPAPASNRYRESLWLTYCRLIGLPTAVLVSIAALLHQLACKLADEPTHWAATNALVGVGVANTAALWFGTSRGGRLLSVVSGLGCLALLGCFWFLELCTEHHALFLVLFSMTAVTWLAAVKGTPQPLLASTDGHMPVETQPGCGDLVDADQTLTDEAQRPRWARYAISSVLGLGFVVYMIVVPAIGLLIDKLNPSSSMTRELTDMTLSESMRLHAVSGVVMCMFLATGASIGSFLNVVIYRLPRFRPLLWPPSACPHCHARIAGVDNIPILAWLKLGGRCRGCHARISARYPIIEALVASIFVLFYYRELLSGGANLPVRTPNMYNGIVWILLYTKWDLVSIYLYHMLLLALLLAWGMINYDRFHVPRYASLGLIALSVGLASVFPFLNPLASDWESPIAGLPSTFALSLLGCLVGGLAGAAFEWGTNFFKSSGACVATEMPTAVARESLAHPSEVIAKPESNVEAEPESNAEAEPESNTEAEAEVDRLPSDPYGAPADVPAWGSNAIASGALVGSQLGLQAVLAIFALTVVLYVAGKLVAYGLRQWRTLEIREIPVTLVIFAITVAYLVFWKQADQFFSSIFIGLGVHMQS